MYLCLVFYLCIDFARKVSFKDCVIDRERGLVKVVQGVINRAWTRTQGSFCRAPWSPAPPMQVTWIELSVLAQESVTLLFMRASGVTRYW